MLQAGRSHEALGRLATWSVRNGPEGRRMWKDTDAAVQAPIRAVGWRGPSAVHGEGRGAMSSRAVCRHPGWQQPPHQWLWERAEDVAELPCRAVTCAWPAVSCVVGWLVGSWSHFCTAGKCRGCITGPRHNRDRDTQRWPCCGAVCRKDRCAAHCVCIGNKGGWQAEAETCGEE